MCYPRVLLVDDHAMLRRGVRQVIEEHVGRGEFAEAADAKEALRLVRSDAWDLVILDISMPGRSGLDVLREIRAARPRLPVLMLSMHPEDRYALRALKGGAAGYITKDASPEDLARAVRKVLGGGTYVSVALAEKLAMRLSAGSPDHLHETLSGREHEVMCLIATGNTVSEIATRLSLSVKTISTYRVRVLRKMGLSNNAELIAYAIRHGLVA